MKTLPLYIIIFLSLIILILFYNLFVSENGYKERDNLIIENQELTNRNDIIKNANEELIFEIVNAQDNDGIAPIHIAAKLDDVRASSMIALLCQHGANLSISTHVKHSAETALHISVRRWAYAATARLLKEGADVLAVDKWGHNCLVCAARHLNREVVLLLLHAVERKLWNVKDVWGHTPLQHSYKLASMFKLHTTIRHWFYCTITFSGGT